MISTPARNASPDGEFVRDTTYIADSFSADLAPGSAPQPADDGTCAWPVEPGRYRLDGGARLPVGAPRDHRPPPPRLHFLKGAYEARFPGYPRGITVPVIVEKQTRTAVTNDFRRIPVDFQDA